MGAALRPCLLNVSKSLFFFTYFYNSGFVIKVILDNLLAAFTPKLQRCFQQLSSTCFLVKHTDSDSHSDRSGNGEQTALLLNTLFMLLLSTEFSLNTTTWKESTSDNHHPGLSHYHFFLCLTQEENSQLMPWVDKQEAGFIFYHY